MLEPPLPPSSLKTHWFYIMLALAERDLHGSGIVRDVLEQTGGEVRLWPATLYGALDELVEESFIEELTGDRHPEGVSGRRRYYTITARGRAALQEEATRLASLAGAAIQRLGGDPT